MSYLEFKLFYGAHFLPELYTCIPLFLEVVKPDRVGSLFSLNITVDETILKF